MNSQFRSYLCIYRGFAAAETVGSRSTFLSGQWGGLEGRVLQAQDILRESQQSKTTPTFRRLATSFFQNMQTFRITQGPQWDSFPTDAQKNFISQQYEVTRDINRMGIRLAGEKLQTQQNIEMISEGVAPGSIQVSAGGQPMILFCEQGTTGGYPQFANVIAADLWKIGQLRPGQKIHFQLIDREEAWQIQAEQEQWLASAVEEF